MDHQFSFRIPLNFGDIVRHVVDQLHAQLFCRPAEHSGKRFSNLMSDDLTIGEGRVGRAYHSRKIILSFDGSERGTGQLLIPDGNPVSPHCSFEYLEMVARDLVTEPTRSAVDH